MAQWGWAIASAILLITLFQLLVYYYLMRGGGDRSVVPPSADGNGNTSPAIGRGDSLAADDPDDRGRATAGLDGREELRRCSRCGAPNENDPVFTYCRNCAAQL